MATAHLTGSPVHTSGELPAVGTQAPAFTVVSGNLADVSLADFAGKRAILNIVPSLDAAVCATSARRWPRCAEARRDGSRPGGRRPHACRHRDDVRRGDALTAPQPRLTAPEEKLAG